MLLNVLINNIKRSSHIYKSRYSLNITPAYLSIACMPNGVKVVTEQTNNPITCVNLFIEVGSRFEKPEINGITHFIEHMAFRGFNDMDPFKLNETLCRLNATFTAITTREFQIFSTICLNNSAGEMIKVLSKVISKLALSEEDIKCEKMDICPELLDTDINSKIVLFDYLKETAFQGTGLAQRTIGPTANIQRFDKSCIRHFMKTNYIGTRIVLSASGGVDHQNIISSAREHLGCLPLVDDIPDYGHRRYTGSQVIFRNDSLPFAHVAIAYEVAGYNSPDYLTLLVAKNIIGSWHKSQGGTNRHANDIALKSATSQLCESFESFYIPYRDVGLWGIYYVCDRMNVDNMVHIIFKQLLHLCNMTVYYEMKRGVNATKLDLAKRADSAISYSRDIGIKLLLTRDVTGFEKDYAAIEKLTSSDIKRTMYSYIYDKCPAVAAVGPTESLPDYTRLRASSYWLRW